MISFKQNIDSAIVDDIDSKEEKRRRRRESWAYIVGLFAVVLLWRSIWDWADVFLSDLGGS